MSDLYFEWLPGCLGKTFDLVRIPFEVGFGHHRRTENGFVKRSTFCDIGYSGQRVSYLALDDRMSVKMPYGHLADYAAVDASGKLILAGIFEIIYTRDTSAELVGALFVLTARLECSIADGLEHSVGIRLVDGEEDQVGDEIPLGSITFTPTGPGRPYAANLMARFAGLQIRGVDDYRFVILVDGNEVGSIPMFVQLAPTPPTRSADG